MCRLFFPLLPFSFLFHLHLYKSEELSTYKAAVESFKHHSCALATRRREKGSAFRKQRHACHPLSSLDNIIKDNTSMFQRPLQKALRVRIGAMGRLWRNYKDRRLERIEESRSFMITCACHVWMYVDRNGACERCIPLRLFAFRLILQCSAPTALFTSQK